MKSKKSRKTTPWEGETNLTATQTFLKKYYETHYADRHCIVSDSGEAEMINSYVPTMCPFCQSEKFKKSGSTKSGVQRYMCECSKTFIPTTGTIFDEHIISISEWMEYCLNLFRHVSIMSSSWNNKNAFTTSRYWLQTLFLTLEEVQRDIVLSDCVWLDETFYTVRSNDVIRKDDGSKLRGLSRNQICIGVATDKQHTLLLVEGAGKPSQKKTFETFRNHIKPGSILIHDNEAAHAKLVRELSLKSISYSSEDLKGLADKDNPMNPVNRSHNILKKFLNAHSGFDRDNLQAYLNLFAFVTNPPFDMLEKVELVVKMAFQNPKLLRYRDFYRANTDF
jgi:transposase-like protein